MRIQALKKECFVLWSKYIRARDGQKCALCGSTKYVTSHHWCLPKRGHADFMFEEDNGVSLCYACHIRKVHREDSSFALLTRIRNYILTACASVKATEAKIAKMISVYSTDSGESVSEEALTNSKKRLINLLNGKRGFICRNCARSHGAKCQQPSDGRDFCFNCAELTPLYEVTKLNWGSKPIPENLLA